VSRFADKQEKRDIKSIFEALDTDADGELTPEDL
jgi:Ca2+-binding EF-hand superfamily protein